MIAFLCKRVNLVTIISSQSFFPGINIPKSGLASNNPELRKPASLIEAKINFGIDYDIKPG